MGSRAQAQQLWHRGLVAPWHVGSSWTRAQTCVPCIGRWILNHCATKEVPVCHLLKFGFYSGIHKDPIYFWASVLWCFVLSRGVTWSVWLNEFELFKVMWIIRSLAKLSATSWEKIWLLLYFRVMGYHRIPWISSHYVMLTGLKRINLWKVRQLDT